MEKYTFLLLLTLLTFTSFGNDGVYLNRGSLFFPAKETKISLEKELLSFTVRDKLAQVDIQFDFFNPEMEERNLLVGFQAPTSGGDVTEEISNHNQIQNFKVVQEGRLLPYRIKIAQCADCDLKDIGNLHFSQEKQGVFVYLFELSFRPGMNRINHSYTFPASNNVAFDQIYNYILTTGAKWSGGTIGELNLQIDLGPNKYFFVQDIFGPTANWSVIGTGKVTGKKFYNFNVDSCRMVRILSGKLHIAVQKLHPTKNIEFGIINDHYFITRETDLAEIKSGQVPEPGNADPTRKYSLTELRLLRNTVFAQHGYLFKDEVLMTYFSKFDWYMPDPNLTIEQIVLTDTEKAFVEEIARKEKEAMEQGNR